MAVSEGIVLENGLSYDARLPRPRRADEADGMVRALNRGHARRAIFKKDADDDAVQRILAAGLERDPGRILSDPLIPEHWHLVLQPTAEGGHSRISK
jgi:putative transposase